MIDLTFVLPVHNVDKLLVARVSALLDLLSELHVAFEVLLIDDGSTDDTLHEANELARRYNQIRVIHRPMRYGRDAAVQLALQQDHAPYVMILGDMARRLTSEIRRLWEARHSRIDAAEMVMQGPKGAKHDPELEFVRPELVTCGRLILLRREFEPHRIAASSDRNGASAVDSQRAHQGPASHHMAPVAGRSAADAKTGHRVR